MALQCDNESYQAPICYKLFKLVINGHRTLVRRITVQLVSSLTLLYLTKEENILLFVCTDPNQ